MAVFGIDDDGHPAPAGRGHGVPNQGRAQGALVVVLEHQGIGRGHHGVDRGPEAGGVVGVERRVELFVDPDHLLAPGDYPGLGGGGPVGDHHEIAVVEALGQQLGPDNPGVLVVAHHTGQERVGPDRGDVGCHVGRAA